MLYSVMYTYTMFVNVCRQIITDKQLAGIVL